MFTKYSKKVESIESSIPFDWGVGEKEDLKLGHLKVCGSIKMWGRKKSKQVFQR